MAKNEMFRVALFGGYNKTDVQEYIQTLENEIESIKVLHQREKNQLLRQIDQNGSAEEKSAEVEELRMALTKKEEELRKTQEKLEQQEVQMQQKEADLKKQEEAKQKNEGSGKQAEREQKGKEASEDHREMDLLRKNNELLRRENEELFREKNKLSEKLQAVNGQLAKKEEELEKAKMETDQGFMDFDTISKVLADANKNAKDIVDEAKQQRDRILQEAVRRVDEQREAVSARINAELENKGLQLIAAKHKIGSYMKEVDSVQKGLYYIHTRMNHLIENMPVRVDDYWENDDSWLLEEIHGEEDMEGAEEVIALFRKEDNTL